MYTTERRRMSLHEVKRKDPVRVLAGSLWQDPLAIELSATSKCSVSPRSRSRALSVVYIAVEDASVTQAEESLSLRCLREACADSHALLHALPFACLALGSTDTLDSFYNADVAVVEMSDTFRQPSLFYHLGVRESFSMTNNIILYCNKQENDLQALKEQCGSYTFIPYVVSPQGKVFACDANLMRGIKELLQPTFTIESLLTPLVDCLVKLLENVHIHASEYFHESIRREIRMARERFSGESLSQELGRIQKRLDTLELLSPDIVMSLLLSYRDIQDYESIINLVETLNNLPMCMVTAQPNIKFQYIFALNRRNRPGDRAKALSVILPIVESGEQVASDVYCLCGRIYKDIRDSTPMDKRKKEKKDKERENEKEKSAITKEKVLKKRRSLPSMKTRPEPSPSPLLRQAASPITPKGRASSSRPASAQSSPTTPKARPKRARTPARVEARTRSPAAVDKAQDSHRPAMPDNTKASSPIPPVVVSAAPETRASKSAPVITVSASSIPENSTANSSIPLTSPAPSPAKPMAGTNDPEEAARILAEKRRQAREQREREEQERKEQEEKNRLEREERLAREVEERKRREEEARLMAEQQMLRDEAQRLQQEKEAQERAKAEQEENERLQRQKEEAEAKAREEAERQRLEREKHFQKEEQERLERKKRLEEIMKRTRKTDMGEKKDTKSSSASQVNGGSSQPESESIKASADPIKTNHHPSTELKQNNESQSGTKESSSFLVINGIQPSKHENGLSSMGEASHFEEIIQLANHSSTSSGEREKSETDIPDEPIVAFDGGNSFLKKAGPMKPQHVAEVL
ncbi:hypothetical protein SRHO_G00054470 [Serrasalmus rhombeus]